MNSQPLFVGQKLEVFVEKLSFNGGRGVSKDQGIVIFIDGAAPNERLLVEITKLKKKWAEAKLIDVLEASPGRRTPPCEVYPQCGGCNLQHIDYSTQLKQKEIILKDQLRPLLSSQKFEIRNFLGSSKEFHYRNRVQFQIQNKKVGFFERGSHRIVDTSYCWIVEEEINQKLQEIRSKGPGPKSSRIEVRSSSSIGDQFFDQVNSQQNEALRQLIESQVSKSPPKIFWDLYGGAGNFSLYLAERFKSSSFTCVESSNEAVKVGRRLSQDRSVSNIEFRPLSVEDFLAAETKASRLILIDPPRAGLSQLARFRLEPLLNGSQLIYLSCNPSSFVRDALEIVQNTSLKLRWVQGIDMFPQTDHIEVLSYFD